MPYQSLMSLCILRWNLPFPINFGVIYLGGSAPQIFTTPFITPKRIVPFIRFRVLKTTSLSSRFQHKTWFLKICSGSRDISNNVSKFRSPNQTFIFLDILANISGPGAYILKPMFTLNPWVQAGLFEYHGPFNHKIFLDL